MHTVWVGFDNSADLFRSACADLGPPDDRGAGLVAAGRCRCGAGVGRCSRSGEYAGARDTALDPLALALLFAVLISLTGVMASAALWMLGAIFLWAFVPRFTARSPA